jgi:hypothetical protein
MDDLVCQHFFLRPAQTLHRQYEALRAVFVARHSLLQVAQQFGYAYGSLRNLVSAFRAQGATGQAPLFSPNRPAAGRTDPIPSPRLRSRSYRLRPTAGNAR